MFLRIPTHRARRLDGHGLSKSFPALKFNSKNDKERLPGGSVVKHLPANAGDMGSIPGLGRCGTRGGFLPRHDEDLSEPLMRLLGSHVSLHVARRSRSLFSSHGRGLGPPDALKKDSRYLSWVAAGNPRFPRLLPGAEGTSQGASEK